MPTPLDTLAADLARNAAAAFPGVVTAMRRVREADSDALTQTERVALMAHTLAGQSRSGAARIAARHLLRQLGSAPCDLVPRSGRGPSWPAAFIGSLAHDGTAAAAAAASRSAWRSVGIDVEPAEALPAELLGTIANRAERVRLAGNLLDARVLFCVKEAVFKTTHPIDGIFLEPEDVEVDLDARTARTAPGWTVRFTVSRGTHIVVLAAIPARVRP